jgi:hypothetical protein
MIMKEPKVDHTSHEHGDAPDERTLCEHAREEAARTAAADVYRADPAAIKVHLITPTVYLIHLVETGAFHDDHIVCAAEVVGPGLGDMRVTVSCVDDDDYLSQHHKLASINGLAVRG